MSFLTLWTNLTVISDGFMRYPQLSLPMAFAWNWVTKFQTIYWMVTIHTHTHTHTRTHARAHTHTNRATDSVTQRIPVCGIRRFPLAPVCTVEKVALWMDLLFIMLQAETDEGVVKDKVSSELGFEPCRVPCSSMLSTRPSLHMIYSGFQTMRIITDFLITPLFLWWIQLAANAIICLWLLCLLVLVKPHQWPLNDEAEFYFLT